MAFATVLSEFVARDSNGSGHQTKPQGVHPRPQPKDRGMEHAKRPASCGWVGLGQSRDGLRGQEGGPCHTPAAKAGCAASRTKRPRSVNHSP